MLAVPSLLPLWHGPTLTHHDLDLPILARVRGVLILVALADPNLALHHILDLGEEGGSFALSLSWLWGLPFLALLFPPLVLLTLLLSTY